MITLFIIYRCRRFIRQYKQERVLAFAATA